MKPLDHSFYNRNTLTVAQELLGKIVIKGRMSGIIVETEAYRGTDDKACHAAIRKKETCFPMWGPPGFTYVYLTYGLHFMFNIVCESEGFPAAVLIRAVEPLEGLELMTKNRGQLDPTKLVSGPGKFTQAFGINKSHNNINLTGESEIKVFPNDKQTPFSIVSSKRIGVDYAGEHKDLTWRYYIEGSKYISRTI